jgi:hypothetical protein
MRTRFNAETVFAIFARKTYYFRIADSLRWKQIEALEVYLVADKLRIEMSVLTRRTHND